MAKDNELCDEGSVLWSLVRSDYSDEKYRRYVDHIKSCKDCMRGLKIDEVITDDHLSGGYNGNDN